MIGCNWNYISKKLSLEGWRSKNVLRVLFCWVEGSVNVGFGWGGGIILLFCLDSIVIVGWEKSEILILIKGKKSMNDNFI